MVKKIVFMKLMDLYIGQNPNSYPKRKMFDYFNAKKIITFLSRSLLPSKKREKTDYWTEFGEQKRRENNTSIGME